MTDYLRQAFGDDLAATLEPEPGPTAIGDDDCNRLLRLRWRLVRDLETVNAVCDAEVARIDAWRAARRRTIQDRLDGTDNLLASWIRMVKARSGGKVKSRALPNGTVRLRAPGAPKCRVPFGAGLVEWAQANDQERWVRTTVKHEPNLTALKADLTPSPVPSGPGEPGVMVHLALDANGEVVPGVLFDVATQDRFYIDPPGGEAEPETEELEARFLANRELVERVKANEQDPSRLVQHQRSAEDGGK